jgi:CubicO group peptidase (beta-lactamase class C family)
VPTERDDRWRHRLVRGQVHDEMAATLGGVAGHAGLFATAAEMGRFGEAWLGLGEPLLAEATRRRALEAHSDDFGLGWRRASASFFPSLEDRGMVGHLGFTGTSLFLFPRQGVVLAVLTNRVYPHRDAPPSRLPLLAELAERVLAQSAWA